jgi:hypothetical protein
MVQGLCWQGQGVLGADRLSSNLDRVVQRSQKPDIDEKPDVNCLNL